MCIARKGTIFLITFITATCYAEMRVHYHPSQTTLTSQPGVTSGFSYSDGVGNSISANQTRYLPVIVQQYPNAYWVYMTGGNIPANAIVVQYINGYPSYSCRVQTNDGIFYGMVVLNRGCAVSEYPQVIFSSYSVLTR